MIQLIARNIHLHPLNLQITEQSRMDTLPLRAQGLHSQLEFVSNCEIHKSKVTSIKYFQISKRLEGSLNSHNASALELSPFR